MIARFIAAVLLIGVMMFVFFGRFALGTEQNSSASAAVGRQLAIRHPVIQAPFNEADRVIIPPYPYPTPPNASPADTSDLVVIDFSAIPPPVCLAEPIELLDRVGWLESQWTIIEEYLDPLLAEEPHLSPADLNRIHEIRRRLATVIDQLVEQPELTPDEELIRYTESLTSVYTDCSDCGGRLFGRFLGLMSTAEFRYPDQYHRSGLLTTAIELNRRYVEIEVRYWNSLIEWFEGHSKYTYRDDHRGSYRLAPLLEKFRVSVPVERLFGPPMLPMSSLVEFGAQMLLYQPKEQKYTIVYDPSAITPTEFFNWWGEEPANAGWTYAFVRFPALYRRDGSNWLSTSADSIEAVAQMLNCTIEELQGWRIELFNREKVSVDYLVVEPDWWYRTAKVPSQQITEDLTQLWFRLVPLSDFGVPLTPLSRVFDYWNAVRCPMPYFSTFRPGCSE